MSFYEVAEVFIKKALAAEGILRNALMLSGMSF